MTRNKLLRTALTAVGIFTVAVSFGGTVSLQPAGATPTTSASHVIVDSGSITISNGSIPVTGTVGLVAGTQISLASGAQVGIAGTPSVQVANTAASPVLVRNLDEHGRQPFQKTVGMSSGPSSTVAMVPAGKRLVMEYLTCFAQMPTGQVPIVNLFAYSDLGVGVLGHASFTKQASTSDGDMFVLNTPFLMYADPTTTLEISLNRFGGSTGTVNGDCTVSGYFVDLLQ